MKNECLSAENVSQEANLPMAPAKATHVSRAVNLCLRTCLLINLALCLILPAICPTETVDYCLHTQSFYLNKGEYLRVWDLKVDLPEEHLVAGRVFIQRDVRTSDSLEMVQETMTRTAYVVRLRLRRGYKASGNGHLYMQFVLGTPKSIYPLPIPDDIQIEEQFSEPFFLTRKNDIYPVSIAIFKDTKGGTLWEKVFTNSYMFLDSSILSVGARYVLMARQSGPEARYSKPYFLAFRIDAREEPCKVCKKGWIIPEKELCPYCRGTCIRPYPYAVPVPLHPREGGSEPGIE